VPPLRRPNKKALAKAAKEKADKEAKKAAQSAARKNWLFFWRKAEKPKVPKLDEQGMCEVVSHCISDASLRTSISRC
jgi:hypothetical protein